MADSGGVNAAEPQLATGIWHLTPKNLAQENGDTDRLTSEPHIWRRDISDNDVGPMEMDALTEHASWNVTTGLSPSQTLARKLPELRKHLEPVQKTTNDQVPASMDKRLTEMSDEPGTTYADALSGTASGHFSSSLDGNDSSLSHHLPSQGRDSPLSNNSMNPASLVSESHGNGGSQAETGSMIDTAAMTTPQYRAMIADELERKWILNLSMHYRDRSGREKFFVTYRKKDHLWRRVTISLDYRDPPPNSLEEELVKLKYQREKSAKIYEAIRESLPEIAFYDTVTNLRLQTTDGRLHVHVVEDGNEIINYPLVDQIRYSSCKRVCERDIWFECHMSGFVYKVRVHGRILIKKEIPSPDTIDEFLYEVNALNSLRYSKDVAQLYAVVVDDHDEHVKGLLISYAEQGALIDIIFDNCKEQKLGIPWKQRERWARQIVQGLADIHESGFVQGDFTLSNIVVDAAGDAKIIDINRRGCPVGWEPPESKTLVAAHQRINMYIGVKSDLYQLGMVLWGLAMLEDEPEVHPRPLLLRPEVRVPDWYRDMTGICLNADPRRRLSASSLLRLFPPDSERHTGSFSPVDDARFLDEDGTYEPRRRQSNIVRTVEPSGGRPYSSKTYVDPSPDMYEPCYPIRGRSPPSPLASHLDGCESPSKPYSSTSWAANRSVRPSYSDMADDDAVTPNEDTIETVLRPETPSSLGQRDVYSAAYIPADVDLGDGNTREAGVSSRSLGDGLQMLSSPGLPRNDTAFLVPKVGKPRPGQLPRLDCFATTSSEATESLSHHARARPPLDARETQTTECDLDGGVSLQSEVGLKGLGMSQMDSQHTASESRQAHENGDDVSEKLMSSTRCIEAELGGNRTRDNATCIKPVSSSIEVEEFSTEHLRTDSQATPNVWSDGKYKVSRRCPPLSRQQSPPLSLAGIGASLEINNDAKMRDEDDVDDDISALARPATVQVLMDATEPQS